MKLGAALVALALTVSTDAAADAKTDALLRELGESSAKVHTLKAEFVQEKHITIVRDVLRSSGTFLLDKNGRIAWAVTEPEPIRIVIRKDGVFAGGKRVGGDWQSECGRDPRGSTGPYPPRLCGRGRRKTWSAHPGRPHGVPTAQWAGGDRPD